MKKYWPYFRDGLGYPEIQHGGPLALLAQAEGGELDALYESGLKLREQFFPSLAEKESVLLHGLCRGVPRHRLEDDRQYRTRVAEAWAWQWQAGRVHGLERIFDSYGFPIVSLPAVEHPAHWAEFDLEVESPPGQALSAETWELLDWIIFEYKRASAMLRTLRLVKRVSGRVNIRMGVAMGERITLYPPSAKPARSAARLKFGGKAITHERWRLGCDCCRHYPLPALSTSLNMKAKAITHERWTIGGSQ